MIWDEPKRESNVQKHGLDFADAGERFEWGTADLTVANMSRRGGVRYAAVGFLDGALVTLIFSALGSEAISAISLRPASRKEKARYDQG